MTSYEDNTWKEKRTIEENFLCSNGSDRTTTSRGQNRIGCILFCTMDPILGSDVQKEETPPYKIYADRLEQKPAKTIEHSTVFIYGEMTAKKTQPADRQR